MKVASLEIELLANIARLQSDMGRAVGTVGKSMGAIEKSVESAKRAISTLGIGLGLGALITQTTRLTDAYTNLRGQLKNATQSQVELGQAMANVRRISTIAQADISGVATAYARLSNNLRDAGVQQSAVADITETVALALKVNGASVAEATSAMQQLSQAFGKGKLDGDEFRTLMEASPNVMRRVAEGMRVPFGALKDLAAQGKITSEVLATVLSDKGFLATVREQAKEMQTISGAFVVMKNKIVEFIGIQAQSSGVVSVLTSGIGLLGDNLNMLAAAVMGLAAAKMASVLIAAATAAKNGVVGMIRYVWAQGEVRASTIAAAEAKVAETAATAAQATATQAMIVVAREEAVAKLASANVAIVSAKTAIEAAAAVGAHSFALRASKVATIELTAAEAARSASMATLATLGRQQASVAAQITATTVAQTAAQTALGTATAATSVGARAMTSALGMLGGPVGWITTLLGLGATAWALWGSKASSAEEKTSGAVHTSTQEIIENLDLQIAKLRERNALVGAGIVTPGQSGSQEADRMSAIRKQMAEVQSGTGQYANMPGIARDSLLAALGTALGTIYGKLQQVNAETKKLEDFGKQSKLAEAMDKYATKTEKMNAELEKWRKELGDAFTPELEQRIRDQYKEADKGAAATKKEASAYAALIASIRAKTEESKLELAEGVKATDLQKIRIKLDADLAAGKLKLTGAHKAEVDAELAAAELAASALEVSKLQAAATREKTDLSASAVKSAYDEARQNEMLARTFGMTKSAIEGMTLAQLEAQLAQVKLTKGTEDQILALEMLIDAHKRNREALGDIETKEAAKKLQDEATSDWKRAVDDYGDVFRRGFADMLNDGEDKWKSFTKSLRTTFMTTVADQLYKAFARPFVMNIVGNLMGVTGGTAASGVAGAAQQAMGGGGGGIMGMISAAKDLYGAVTAGFAGISSSVAGWTQSAMNFISGSGGFVGQGPMQISGFAQGVGTLGGIAAGAGIGIMGGNLISGRYSAMGSNPSNAVYTGTAVGAAIGSIIPVIGTALGAAVGGLLGGLYNRAFGYAEKEFGDTSIVGNLTASGFRGYTETPWDQDGGWFKSDRSGMQYGNISRDFEDKLGAAFLTVRAGVASLAESVGVSSDRLVYYSERIKLTLTDDAQKNQELIASTLASVGNNMINYLIPSLAKYAKQSESATQTLERLSVSLTTVNNLLGMVRKDLLDVSLAGAEVASDLADVFGGLDQLGGATQAFYEAVYTEGERVTHSLQGMRVALRSVGVSMPRTIVELRDMALAMDLTTEAGRLAYATLLTIAPEFAAVADATKQLADEMSAKLIESFTMRGQLIAALNAASLKTLVLGDSLTSTFAAAGNISTLFLDLSSGLISFGGVVSALDGEMTGAQVAGGLLRDQMVALRIGANGAMIDFGRFAAELGNFDTDAFIATISKAFENLAQRVDGLIGDITTERIAVREAAMQIIDPSAMTPEMIRRQIAGINTTLPGNSGVIETASRLSAADAVAEEKRKAEEAARKAYEPAQATYDSAKKAVDPLITQVANAQAYYDQAYGGATRHYKYSEGRAAGRMWAAQLPGLSADLEAAKSALAAARAASTAAKLEEVNRLQEAYNDALAESATATEAANAAALDAKQSQIDFADALQGFAIDATKSVAKLSSLREETVKYYQAQKQLADLMGASAAGLRKTVADYRYGQMDPEEQFNKLQGDYAKAYAMALSTDGDVLTGYADQLNSMLNPMLEKARGVFGSDAQYNVFAATALARAENIANRLDLLKPSSYEAESLDLLGQIDATLAALEESSRSAEALIVAAVNASRDATVDGLRQIANALTGQTVAAFASGGDHLGGLRLVGERGPEIEATGPSRIFNASQTRGMLTGGGDNGELLSELRELRAEVANLRIEARATASNTGKLARQGDRQEIDGLLVRTDADEPLLVQVEAV